MSKNEDLYPTRGDREKILERKDPVVFDGEKHSPYGLGPEEVIFYEKNGFIVFPGFFSPEEVSLFHSEHERLKKLEELKNRDELICELDSKKVRSIFSPKKFSDIFDQLSRDKRILEKVRQLLGSEVYIHHSRINIKPAYCGKSFPWHSNFETWHAKDASFNRMGYANGQ